MAHTPEKDSQVNTEEQREIIHNQTHRRNYKSYTFSTDACQHIFPVCLIVITIVYFTAIMEKLAQLQGWLENPVFITISTDSDEAFLLAFTALGMALGTWVICCCGGCFVKRQYDKRYNQSRNSEQDMAIEIEVSPNSNGTEGNTGITPQSGASDANVSSISGVDIIERSNRNGSPNNSNINNDNGNSSINNNYGNNGGDRSKYKQQFRYNEGFDPKRHGPFILMDFCIGEHLYINLNLIYSL